LACSAKRLPVDDALPLIGELLLGDAHDPHIPLLIWWALERHVEAYGEELILLLRNRTGLLDAPIMRDVVLERLARRFIAKGSEGGYNQAATLLEHAPTDADRLIVIRGMNQALQGKLLNTAPRALAHVFPDLSSDLQEHPEYLQLLVRLGFKG